MLHDVIERISPKALRVIREYEAVHAPLVTPLFFNFGSDVSMIYDPSARHTGFVLQIRALTDDGWLEASFRPDGELARGLVGDTLVIDAERLIRAWRDTAAALEGDDHAVV